MSLHQSDLEALESSNEICQSKHTNLKSKPPQNQRNNKDKQEKVKAKKGKCKRKTICETNSKSKNERQSRK